MSTALLVMDVQAGIVGRLAGDAYLDRLVPVVDAARAAGVPVMYVVVGFRSGMPERNERNLSFGALPPGTFTPEDPAAAIHEAVAPRPGDVIITKKRVSAFAGSDLELVLRSQGIDHLVLTGIATSGVVLSTLRQAADLDYRLTVIEDACADRDEEVHSVLTRKVFPRQAEVMASAEWIAALKN